MSLKSNNSNMKRSRESDKQQNKKSECKNDRCESDNQSSHSISSVSDDIIRNISSYLFEKDYKALSRTSKHHWSVCRSPIMIEALQFESRGQALELYPKLKLLHIDDLWNFVRSYSFESIVTYCRELNTLQLFVHGANAADFGKFLIQRNAESECINRITSLELLVDEVPTAQIYRLLSRLPALVTLSITECEFSSPLDADTMISLCPNLQELVLAETDILGAFLPKLNSLQLPFGFSENLSSHYDWSKLQRLYLALAGRPKTEFTSALNHMFLKAKCLKKIALSARWEFDEYNTMDFMTQIISEHPQLEFLCIEGAVLKQDSLNQICQGINRGLWESRETTRDVLEIAFRVSMNSRLHSVEEWEWFMYNMSRILFAISRTQTCRWMVSVKPDSDWYNFDFVLGSNKPMSKVVTSFIESCVSSDIKLLLMSTRSLVFGNGGDAVLNRHEDWWMYFTFP